MRESLFEQLKKEKICFIQELYKIIHLLYDSYHTTSYFREAFKDSAFSVYYADLEEALISIFESNIELGFNLSDMSSLIRSCIQSQADLTLDSYLNYLELFKTLSIYSGVRNSGDADQIIRIVENDCDKSGYKFIKDRTNKVFYVMLKNPEAEATALSVKKDVRDKIYNFLTIRDGKINEKRECIKSLADDVEVICKKYSNIPEYDKLKQFIQCTRHTKDSPKVEFPFYYEEEEKWLNKTFDMIIGILSFTHTKEIVKEIKTLENKK